MITDSDDPLRSTMGEKVIVWVMIGEFFFRAEYSLYLGEEKRMCLFNLMVLMFDDGRAL